MRKEMNIELMKQYRLRKGLCHDDVSRITGIDIPMLESGFTGGIKLSQLEKLAKLYGCVDSSSFYKDELDPEIKTHICYKIF